jgi:hypothetical protein
VTVDTPIIEPPVGGIKAPTTIKPKRSNRSKGVKEPEKGTVSLIASSLQDIYGVMDGGLSLTFALMDKEYPENLFALEDEKATKMAYAMAQMNNSFASLAEKVNNVSAPMTLAAILISDLGMKGVALYAAFKSQKRTGTNSNESGPKS